jgi:hypothetical protein
MLATSTRRPLLERDAGAVLCSVESSSKGRRMKQASFGTCARDEAEISEVTDSALVALGRLAYGVPLSTNCKLHVHLPADDGHQNNRLNVRSKFENA